MVSLLEGKLKKVIAQKFHRRLLKGVINRKTPTTVNSFGDPVPGTAQTFTFEGIRESFDASYAARAGIPQTDVKVLVLLGSVKPETQPRQNDYIYIGVPQRWHQVRHILAEDPAGASMDLQCYEIDGLPA